ncbi:Retrovirus-related Pol polyprotein from transposon 17.6 [Araneus ventricosus]|uniref:RNA-directed DNA polymerase n=1 Tax=Araneus ventricosus TaxID=182803 RepID=A0A4Y2T376_ARAVE|nr:Retrovirus-related Pol polyprotein from transposon 17.6 [Araneus ventricosus]
MVILPYNTSHRYINGGSTEMRKQGKSQRRTFNVPINKYKGNNIPQNSNFKKESESRGFSKKFETNADRRKKLQCFECGSYEHLRPQCPQIRAPKSEVNRIGRESDRSLLDPYTKIGKINGYSMPILRDTGATVDVVCQKYVNRDRMTGEHVWVKHIFDDHMTCLPVAQIDVECDLGRVTTKAVVVEDKLDQGRYILGNQTADLLKQITESSKLNSEIVNAVVTRSKGRKLENDKGLLEEQINTEIYDEDILGDGENQAECMVNDEVLPKTDLSDPLKKLIEVDSSNFIGEQQKSKELALLFELVKTKGNQTNFDVKNGVLVRKKINKLGVEEYAIVVPETLREQIKTMCHEGTSGHLGVLKTKDRLLRHFFWPNCYKDIEEFVKTCDPCQRVGKTTDKKKAPLVAVPIISEVFSKLNIDACGPLPTSTQGNKFIITVMCLASKYPDAVPVPDITSKSVVNALLQIFSRMGFPREIQTDQGKSFMSILTVEFLEKFGIKIVRSSIYHPQSNPVERFHRSVKRILRVLCIEAAPDWETQIPAALFALRTVTHESTGFSPAELVHGNNLRTPAVLLYEKWLMPEEQENIVLEYVFELINRLRKSRELAKEKMEEMRDRRKKWYDRNAIKREFHEGDSVLVLSVNQPHKLAPQWKGPGTIEKKLSETNYVVSFEGKQEINKVYHINMLKPYFKRPELVNIVNHLETETTASSELEEDFPYMLADPNVFDFQEVIETNNLRERLSDDQIGQLENLLVKYYRIFSNIPGKTNLVEHDIELICDKPIKHKPYRMTNRQNDLLKAEIGKMLKYNIIEPGASEFTSPMILVETPGREPRPCIDYRKLNEITRTQFYPIPNIEQRVETVAKARYITLIDLTKGYWQIPLSKRAQGIAAFATSWGVYRPLRMPFGLKNAPFYFSKMMNEILEGCDEYAIPYLDDIAIFSQTWDEHLKHLQDVLERIKRAKLTIKPPKCKFAQDQVQYLGHIVGHGKRSPAELKVKAVQNFPIPTTKTEIRAFLGLAGYYRQYIPMFSVITAPLTDLLKGRNKKGKIEWNEECTKAIELLKDKLTSKPILHAPDFTKPFILQTDASDLGYGVVLAQKDNEGREHPILYISKKFTSAERKYSTTEKECAAILYGIKKLKGYIDGQTEFCIQTDHNPLVWLKKNAGTNQRLLRWALALQAHNYTIEHKKGKDNLNVDCLSRNPLNTH